jgi:hypothetical protein
MTEAWASVAPVEQLFEEAVEVGEGMMMGRRLVGWRYSSNAQHSPRHHQEINQPQHN